jgi:hypothetical protein
VRDHQFGCEYVGRGFHGTKNHRPY